MSFPKQVQAALERVGPDGIDGELALTETCQGAKFHSPTPLVLHPVTLGGETCHLCGTCRDNLAVIQHLLEAHEGDLEWPVRREFGNVIRALAERGWQADHPEGSDEDEGEVA